jgi:DNA-binding transcriptional LysR family regulator
MDGVISAMIALFQQQTPDVRVDQSYGYAAELIDKLRNGTLDVAILPLQKESVPADLEFQPILAGLNVIACRAGHPLTRKKLVTPREIEQYAWIAPPADSPLYKDLRRALKNIGTEDFRISFSGGSLASVIEVLSGSDSLTVLPYSVVFMMRDKAQITALSLEIGHPDRELGLLAGRAHNPTPATQRFQSFVTAQFESLSRRIGKQQADKLWR